MNGKRKIIELILDNKLSKYELSFLKDNVKNFVSLKPGDIEKARKIVEKAFHGKILKQRLRNILFIRKKYSREKIFLVLFPKGIFTLDEYTLGTIEIEKDENVHTVNFVSYESGEIKQEKYQE
jgi:hypothetical protein